jgi:PAS domain S-box-containing protein
MATRLADRGSGAAQAVSPAPDARELRGFWDHSRELLCVVSLNGYFIHVNPAWTSALGFSCAELIGRPYTDFVHPDDLAATLTAGESLRSSRSELGAFENRYRCKAGGYRWLRWHARPELARDVIVATARDVTDIKHAEAQTRLLAAVVLDADDAIFTKDRNSVITQWNRGAERLYGYSAAEVLGNSVKMLIPAAEAGKAQALMSAVLAGEHVDHRETRRRCKDGRIVDVSVSLSPARDGSGAIIGVTSSARDISDRRRHDQDALDRAHGRYEQVVESAQEGIWIFDATGATTLANRRMGEMLGTEPEELLGMTLDDFTDDADRTIADAHAASREPGSAPTTDFRLRPRNGEPVWARIQLSPFIDGDGGLPGVLAMVRDVTDRKTVEDALRRSERQLQSIMDGSDSIIFVRDTAGRFTLVNRAFEAFFDADRADALGMTTTELMPEGSMSGAEIERTLLCDARVIHTREPVVSETFTCKLGKSRTYLSARFPLFDEQGGVTAVCTMASDITERKRVELEVETLNTTLEARVVERTAELETANSELEAFSYSVSHDLRAPLRTVSGFAHLLERESSTELSGEGLRYLGLIKKGAADMGQLIDELLVFAQLSRQALAVGDCDPAQVAVIALDQVTAGDQVRIDQVQIAEMPSCRADPALLGHVYANLISNALKFSRTQPEPSVEIGAQIDESNEVVYFVRDNGVGFDQKYVGKLFGVFQRLHRAEDFEGTGVGLAIVQRIIARHGGRIWAEGATGKGATFFFTIGGHDE